MIEPLAYTIPEACKAAAVSRTELYRAFARNELSRKKRGKRSLVLAEDLRRWVESLPNASHAPSNAA